MYLTGIADEASQNIETQIEVTRQLGWNAIESRFIDGKNIHDLGEEAFEIRIDSGVEEMTSITQEQIETLLVAERSWCTATMVAKSNELQSSLVH